MKIQHIVFDIGRVLLHWDAELIYVDLIDDPAERREFIETVCSPAWNLEQDRGRDWRIAEDLLIEQYPNKANLIRAYRTHWSRSIPHAIEGTPQLMVDLMAKGYDVTLLTNFNQDTYLEAEAAYPFLKEPRGVTVSGRVQLLKPDPAIYDLHAKTFGLTPSSTLFIDDSEKNVEGAKNCGWQAVHFTDAKTLKADLQRFELV